MPVNYVLSGIVSSHNQNGGEKSGPFEHKVVPVGLVYIQMKTERLSDDYSSDNQPATNCDVISESIYDAMFDMVAKPTGKRSSYATPPKKRAKQTDTKKMKSKHAKSK